MDDSCAQLSKGEGITTTCSTESSEILDILGGFWGFCLGWVGCFLFCVLVGRLGISESERESELIYVFSSF